MLLNKLKRVFIITLLSTAVTALAGQTAPAPMKVVKQTSYRLIAALKERKSIAGSTPIQVQTVESIVRQNLLPLIDVEDMSSAVLGRYIRQAQKQPKRFKAFKKQFIKLVISTYAAPLSNFNNDKVQFKPLRKFDPTQDTVRIKSRIVRPTGQKIPVTYYLKHVGGQWKVYDFGVDGISMVESYRSQFASILAQRGFDGLVKEMNKKRV